MKNPFTPTKFDTDKIQLGFMEEYKRILAPLTYRPISLLEIGVNKGGSILFWDDYLQNKDSRILGLDLKLPEIETSSRVSLAQCDQNDADGLRGLAELHGPFDVIIDDASHQLAETRTCFNTLQPFLKPGGYYVIEDWAMGYFATDYPQYQGMVEFVTEIVRNAKELNLAAIKIICEKQKSMAFFQKGSR